MEILIKQNQIDYFYKQAKKHFPKEIFCFLSGREQPENNFIVDKFLYLDPTNGTEDQFWVDFNVFKKLLKQEKLKGREIIGYLHSHCFQRAEGLYDNVPSNADYELINIITEQYDKAAKLVGIVTIHKNKNKFQKDIIFYPARKKVKIKWQKQSSPQTNKT